MPRPSQAVEKRSELIPVVARAFAELGFRRATTAELAERCGVQENILYRLWADKKAMFIAAIEHVFELSAKAWRRVIDDDDGDATTAERLLAYESRHLGDLGLVRIVFAGLNEADDPDIRRALGLMYRRYQAFVAEHVRQHRGPRVDRGSAPPTDDADLVAWAFIGIGTIGSIARELRLLGDEDRRRLLTETGRRLLD